jgi:BirA family biotin operon repressor/biotin-[acetyl-CoA-carboxylase] ligase
MLDGKTLSWIHLPSVDSTVYWVKKNAKSFPQDSLTIVYTDEQTSGVGQHGRKWISFPGVGLYTTWFFRLDKSFPYLQNLGQILAISCIEILQNLGFHPQMKWPNDLLLDEKKFGGVLVETIDFDKEWGISISIGINVNTEHEQLQTLDVAATSLSEISHIQWKIDELLFQLVERFLANLQLLEEAGFSLFSKKIQSVLAFVDKEVLFSDGKRSFTAICKGIDDKGRLELQHTNGHIDHVYAGTIKKLVS